MSNSKIVMMAMASISLAAGSVGCSAKIDGGNLPLTNNPNPVAKKAAGDPNWAQCGDSQIEVLVDLTSSDLESANFANAGLGVTDPMHEVTIYTRDITQAGSAYSAPVQTDGAIESGKDVEGTSTMTADPGNRFFDLVKTETGEEVMVETKDFQTGDGTFTPATGQAQHTFSTCKLYVDRPAALPVPSSTPPTPPTPPTVSTYYLDCTGQTFEVYANYSNVDSSNWEAATLVKMGERPVSATTANFTTFGMVASSAGTIGSSAFLSINAQDQAGNQFNVNLNVADLSTASGSVSATAGSDTLSCKWLTSNIYAGQYGW